MFKMHKYILIMRYDFAFFKNCTFKLKFNVEKCKKMTISNLSNETNFDYILNGSILPNCGHVRASSLIKN